MSQASPTSDEPTHTAPAPDEPTHTAPAPDEPTHTAPAPDEPTHTPGGENPESDLHQGSRHRAGGGLGAIIYGALLILAPVVGVMGFVNTVDLPVSEGATTQMTLDWEPSTSMNIAAVGFTFACIGLLCFVIPILFGRMKADRSDTFLPLIHVACAGIALLRIFRDTETFLPAGWDWKVAPIIAACTLGAVISAGVALGGRKSAPSN